MLKKTAGKLKTGQFGFAARATLAPLKKRQKRQKWQGRGPEGVKPSLARP